MDITADTPIQGTLCPQFDDDGFRIHVANPGSILIVTLSMATPITNIDPSYNIFKDNGDGSMTALAEGGVDPDTTEGHATNFTSSNRVEDAGDYIIDVVDSADLGAFDNTNKYTLTVSVIADPDPNEPNNLPTQATPIVSGTPMNGIIATAKDEDWYAITVTGTAQIIDLAISVPAGSGVTHLATLLAPDALTVLQTATLTADPNDATHEVTRLRKPASDTGAGPFLLQIKATGSNADTASQVDPAKGQYTINLTLLADPDGNEGTTGNSDIATATNVTSGQTVNAALSTLADRDVYRIDPPGGTTRNAPPVLLVDVTFDSGTTISEAFKPQVRIVGSDPEDGSPDTCTAGDAPRPGCTECYGKCAEDRLQRFVRTNAFHTAFPLRNTEPVFVEINEFNDDAFQDGGTYTVHFSVIADPDPGEKGDDFLIPNLEFAGFADDTGLNNQLGRARPRSTTLGYNPVCADGANDGTDPAAPGGDSCIDTEPVAVAVGFGFPTTQVACADVPTKTTTLTGKLTYEGDRDYFLLADYPNQGYMNLHIDYTISQATPVELAIFVHKDGGGLIASTLKATEDGGCSDAQGGQNACLAGEVCVDEHCWSDGDSNAGGTTEFGQRAAGDGECIVTGPNGNGPVFIEVVDNGLNDFDLNMTYTLNVTVSCGCPATCDTDQDFCQNG
ncbi:MAG TPA: hypothetical protein VGM78_00050 [Ilumatobacteraceae bacterium]